MAVTRERIQEIAGSLSPVARVFAELDGLLRDKNNALEQVANLLERDAMLAAHIIRLGASAAGDGKRWTGSMEEAVGRLGWPEIFHLVGDVATARAADRALKHYGVEAEELREHMLHTALACEYLAAECGLDARRAYAAGLMRPLGLLVLDRLADRNGNIKPYDPARDGDYLTWERRWFGSSSPEVTALLLIEWKFPTEIVEAVRSHYLLRAADRGLEFACLLNLASGLAADHGHGLRGEARQWDRSQWKLEKLGLTEARFRTAGERARKAFGAFKQRLRGVAGPEAAGAGSARGQMEPDSRNFPRPARVVESNDETPVHTPSSGMTPPADFTTFMHAYQDMVFSTAARLTNNEAQAEDISQEVFLKAHEHFDSLSTSPTAGGWLKTVATNLSLNHLSRYRNRWKFFSEFRRADDTGGERDEPAVEFAAPDTFFAGVDADERRVLVERALEQLPEHQRVPLVLYHFEDMPYDEIARKLRVSLAKVKTDILRARAALAKILSRSGGGRETLDL
jgi:RNA polymerase sigma-70 factor, ECF subfamily